MQHQRWLRFGVLTLVGSALILGGAACSGDETADKGGAIKLKEDTNGGGVDGQVIEPDAGTTDVGLVDAGSSSGADTGTTISIDCPGGASCPCTSSDECTYGLCAATQDGMQCVAPCSDGCSGDFECKKLEVKGGDSASVCVHKAPNLCTPCKSNAVCSSAFDPDAKCIDRGNDGFYCGTTCASNSDCLSGYACDKVKDIDGKEVSQCVTEDGSICKCSALATTNAAVTACKDAQGCSGERKCLAKGAAGAPAEGGLSQCSGGAKNDEKCDGLDNNCDGATDEGTCDDKESCTTDSCDAKTGNCTHTPLTGSCDDGDACTESDVCSAGACAGAAKKCDDSEPCTTDSCKDGKCQTAPNTDKACDDNDKCTDADKCNDKGKCTGAAKNCDDGNKCSIDTCADGKCSSGKVQEGPCEDGDLCTTGDLCKLTGGKLVCEAGKAKVCDDANECTLDTCEKATGCVGKIDEKLSKPCYTHDAKYKGIGACVEGAQTCQKDGSLGKCDGDVAAAPKDACGNGKDDDCDGVTDNGCAPSGVIGRFGSAVVEGKAGKNSLRAFVGGSIAAGAAKGTGKNSVEFGFYAWVSTLVK
jgi:hypothetical protein